jgi:hypothetical protein
MIIDREISMRDTKRLARESASATRRLDQCGSEMTNGARKVAPFLRANFG